MSLHGPVLTANRNFHLSLDEWTSMIYDTQMDINEKTLPQITAKAVSQLDDRLWGPFAAVIDKVQRDQLWRYGFANFSEWMSFISTTYNISRARCWRYKKAGSYYNKLRSHNQTLCELEELPDFISAEALEILERLERVAPTDITTKLSEQILTGKASIRSVKQTWEAYRPALQGATNRGRGDDLLVASLNEADRFEAESILVLSQNHSWTKVNSPARCYVYPKIYDKQKNLTYDVIALVQLKLDSPVQIHTFEIHYEFDAATNIETSLPEAYVDYCWIILQEKDAVSSELLVDPKFGIIGVRAGELYIHRSASAINPSPGAEPFMKELLKLALRK